MATELPKLSVSNVQRASDEKKKFVVRVLILLPEMPASAGTGGQVRAYHFVRAAAQVADVTALVFAAGDFPAELESQLERVMRWDAPPVESSGGNVRRIASALFGFGHNHGRSLMLAGHNVCVARSQDGLGFPHRAYGILLWLQASLLSKIRAMLPTDIHVRVHRLRDLASRLQSASENSHFDFIWCEHSHLYPLAHQLQKSTFAALITNCHNVECVLKQSIAATMGTPLARRWMRLESAIIRKWERRMLTECCLLYCCSEEDAQSLRSIFPSTSSEIAVIPNGVDAGHFHYAGTASTEPTILFAGTAGYAPNDDAVRWLTERIFPRIRQRVPACALVLAGRSAEKHWSAFATPDSGVEVASDVPDMRTWLASAWVSVAPLRAGSGTRLKIIEAMSSGRAVVSTTIGAEGLELTPGKHLLIEDDPDRFADAVAALIDNPTLRHSIEQAGRAVAVERFDWNDLSDQAATVFRRIAYGIYR